MIKVGVICAMEEEIRTLLARQTQQHETIIASQHYFEGKIGDVDVILVQSGIGKVQAAMTAALLLATYKPDVVINTGSAGGIGHGLAIGDVVISSGVSYHDVDATAFGYLPGQLPQQPQIFEAGMSYVTQIQTAAAATGLTPKVGLIVSGDQFINGKEAIARILKTYPQALASEMEGAAVGQVAKEFHTPFVVIRAMSDVADEQSGVDFDKFVIKAGEQSAAMLLQFFAHLQASQHD
ncbi:MULTISPECIES: 5'-methylthioadenosine/adenosylhomocysteine nucleosidase [Lacticaseibacillus]|uniref:adenosylhomocysteine nucleosidase n=1 Tax=Lacticaseibacillus casei DSM 20011 = JCM 1134 = ATCC 393 TaxID=1423732 RepID=A0AAD1ANV6_LACCA|nr:5'-methylthioadenosine/adenosylhomocysteine nucleosidase [Lacticaseibacillus casei]HAJ55316.1 5'-methylthioadenosine/adenosylhomocysteine nucleosidase [Lactobacillus sp.]MBI6597625.1 5'-methylthioadenosine/adenosylhomocysteine nucleosidase [Lacticaseibacillus casei]MBO1481346.1 5'-methylthioadenosine/adenosylhomocysteine nucleosidase [Lacticaseibacillus casei]MBO2416604.1 5'-methylthioadenosine/adenosylhomocysteine nucleosidase [Lacticaseibacillus casei]MCK2080374.1 5'-methylthioadenosine/a